MKINIHKYVQNNNEDYYISSDPIYIIADSCNVSPVYTGVIIEQNNLVIDMCVMKFRRIENIYLQYHIIPEILTLSTFITNKIILILENVPLLVPNNIFTITNTMNIKNSAYLPEFWGHVKVADKLGRMLKTRGKVRNITTSLFDCIINANATTRFKKLVDIYKDNILSIPNYCSVSK